MTTYIVTTETTLDKIAAPNLPLAPNEWDRRYQDQFANVLRLYFNRLDSFLAKLNTTLDTDFYSKLKLPYGAFHQNGATTLSSNITNNSTTPIQVASTAGFPSSGWILIGSEIISYTTKTATQFGGAITRGVLGTTNVAHTAGAAITEVQGTGSPTTIGKVLFNNTDYSNGVYADPTDETKLYFTYPGIYNLQFSAQLLNYTTSEDNVTIWFAQNGTDVTASASIEQVNAKHGTSPGARICTVNLLLQVDAGHYVTLNWTSDTGNSIIGSFPAGTSPVHPISPGLIFTATFVSAPPA